ncbi:MAG: GNAT family N-acetyltransferase [Acidimicrobiales bacterium]
MPEPELRIETAKAASTELVSAFQRLIPQLSRSSPPPTEDELASIIASPDTDLLVARLGGEIVGTLTLVIFRIPTAVRAWIEDVVVDEAAGGRGIGRALTEEALSIARTKGARTVDLTSRPSREAANRLYQRVGFERRESNLYRFSFDV